MRSHVVATVFLAVSIFVGLPVLTAVGAVWISQQKMIDYQVANKIDGCEAANNSRAALLTVLDQAANPPDTGAGAVALTALPAYAQVDPATQVYLQQLEKALADQPDGTERLQQIHDDLSERNPANVDCEQVGRDLREELEGFNVF